MATPSSLRDVIKHRSEVILQMPLRKSKKSIQHNCMLVIIGILVVCSMLLSLSIGHYHHNQYADQILSMTSSSSLQSKLRDFLEDETNGKSRGKKTKNDKSRETKREIMDSNNDERSIFESIIKRVKWTEEQCNSTPRNQRDSVKKALKVATDLPMLPEGGVAPALEKWLKENPPSSSTNNDYPTCYLPPPKSCNVTTYTLVIMSHTTERLQTFMDPLVPMVDSWPGLTEIIIVWNSPREKLAEVGKIADGNQRKYATQLLQWDEDASHPLRIFFSLDNGLANNLLNRYHPKLKPKNEAVMYFDDDGPFWSRDAMVYGGLELWKRNSNVQVGAFPRNVRFLSDRMKRLEKTNLQQSIDIVVKDVDSYSGESHATFTPVCRNVTRDHVEYNFFTFPDFAGHVLLPSGTFLHRNFLCFIWHPAFEELRQWVITHKTMPDDMTVSTLISHLSERAPRTFPREVATAKKRRLSSEDAIDDHIVLHNERFFDHGLLQSPEPDQSHRRLLWKQKNWGGMREEAINSILGYFGSIHPGTVGWCAGTPYMKNNNRGVPFVCHPEKPTLDILPWLTEGGIGSTQCPFDPDIIDQSLVLAKEEDPTFEFDDFCGECPFKDMGITCQKRMQYLIDKYSNAPLEAKNAVIKEDSGCEKER
mmetsp:Transcript_16144/g.30432  ORF Transcript_16144/g.30432 Transcript_16144/m.30432 type:complete len:648 (+) Transcript_16144:142-2085(+)